MSISLQNAMHILSLFCINAAFQLKNARFGANFRSDRYKLYFSSNLEKVKCIDYISYDNFFSYVWYFAIYLIFLLQMRVFTLPVQISKDNVPKFWEITCL